MSAGSVLVRISRELPSFFGTRSEDGRRLSFDLGDPIGQVVEYEYLDTIESVYEPVITATDDGVRLVRPGDLDALARAAHDAWFAEKRRRLDALGRTSWPSETGEEQLVPWDELSEPVRDFDRIVVRAILDEITR